MSSKAGHPPGGYLGIIATDTIRDWAKKPLFGRPYLTLGSCLKGLWPYVFEIGGILAAKHAATLDAFMSAFLGFPSQAAGAISAQVCFVSNRLIERHSMNSIMNSLTIRECVEADVMQRFHYTGDDLSFLLTYGPRKTRADKAFGDALMYASIGAALGVTYPDAFRAMYERSHIPVPAEHWQLAYAAGADVGPEQPRQRSYRQAEEEENKGFMQYCIELRPDLYPALNN